ncbi:MAG TPA: cell filamentation protein Fic, partial [Micromonosporaceae bacterium]|nr:cell filamentation protein Fic [Micromonosporaceae bacterium]
MTSDLWPVLQYESLPWNSTIAPGVASRSQLRRHQGPYQAAIAPEISARRLILASDVLAAADDASNEIARFDAGMGGEIAPFGAVLLRSESAASSQIENLTASARAIAEAEIGDTGRRNATQIVANTRAMEAAVALADKLDANSILVMHRALMEASEPATAGRWREEQNWIGGGNFGPHGAMFVPPHHSRVEAAIEDLAAFIQRDDLPVLVQAAIAHAQFETIHPFNDGNGRTGRALLHAMLRNKALTRNVTVPVSAGLLTDTAAYFHALGAYRAGDPSVMVRQLADASFIAVANGRQLVGEMREIRAAWNERVSARRDSKVWRVADVLMRHPVINAPLLTRELGIAANNVHRYIDPLESVGVLTEFTDRKRNKAWRSVEILAAL